LDSFLVRKINLLYAMNGGGGEGANNPPRGSPGTCQGSYSESMSDNCPSIFDVAIVMPEVGGYFDIGHRDDEGSKFTSPLFPEGSDPTGDNRVGRFNDLGIAEPTTFCKTVNYNDECNCGLDPANLASWSGGSGASPLDISPIALQELITIEAPEEEEVPLWRQIVGSVLDFVPGASDWIEAGTDLLEDVNLFTSACGWSEVELPFNLETNLLGQDPDAPEDPWDDVQANFEALQGQLSSVQDHVLQVVDARAAELSSFVTNSVNAAQIETLVATKVGILMTLVQKYDYLVTLVLTARVQDEPLGDEWNSLIYSVFLDAMSAMPSLMLKGTGFVNNPLLLAQTLFIFKDYVQLAIAIGNEFLLTRLKETTQAQDAHKLYPFVLAFKNFLNDAIVYIEEKIDVALEGMGDELFPADQDSLTTAQEALRDDVVDVLVDNRGAAYGADIRLTENKICSIKSGYYYSESEFLDAGAVFKGRYILVSLEFKFFVEISPVLSKWKVMREQLEQALSTTLQP